MTPVLNRNSAGDSEDMISALFELSLYHMRQDILILSPFVLGSGYKLLLHFHNYFQQMVTFFVPKPFPPCQAVCLSIL